MQCSDPREVCALDLGDVRGVEAWVRGRRDQGVHRERQPAAAAVSHQATMLPAGVVSVAQRFSAS